MYIKNIERNRQFIDFEGLNIGNSRPMDVDCMVEYRGKGYVFIESKHGDAAMSKGQEIAYKRIVDDITASGKEALFIVAEHYVSNCDEPVLLRESEVRQFYWKGKFHKYNGSTEELFHKYINYLEGSNVFNTNDTKG